MDELLTVLRRINARLERIEDALDIGRMEYEELQVGNDEQNGIPLEDITQGYWVELRDIS